MGIKRNKPKSVTRGLFSSESRLVGQVAIALAQTAKQNTSVSFEVPSSNGVADIVVAQLSTHLISKKTDIGAITPRWGYALALLPYRKAFTTIFLRELAGVNISTARAMLRNFQSAGFCRPTNKKGHWIKTQQPAIPAKKIVAYEAKLRNWQRALYQANRYLAYADYSWVILDKKNITPAIKNIQYFESLGIGLISVDPEDGLENIYPAKKNGPKSPWSRWEISLEMLKCRLRASL